MKLYAHQNNYKTHKALVAAKYAGLDIEVPPEAAGAAQTGKIPVLETDQGCIFTSIAISRYLSRLRRDVGLYGQNLIEGGLIDSWVEFSTHELEIPLSAWVFPLKGIFKDVPEATKQAKEDVRRALDVLNNHLLQNTYMVGHQVTLADICIACALADAMPLALDDKFLKPLPNLMRWYSLISAQPEFVAVLGKAPAAPKAAPAAKSEAKKDAAPKKEAAPKKDAAPKKEAAPKGEAKKEKEGKKDGKAKAKAEPKAEETPKDPEAERKAQLKKCIKEGGKRGVEIEGAADMGGLQFFCTAVEFPEGDLEMLDECLKAMNAKSDPTEEERKGGSGHIGKMIFSAGTEQLAVAAYVPEDKQKELSTEEWLKHVLASQGGEVTSTSASCCLGFVKADGDKNIFPLKIREPMILEANNYLRKKGLFPEDNSDDDEMVFGDDDFPS